MREIFIVLLLSLIMISCSGNGGGSGDGNGGDGNGDIPQPEICEDFKGSAPQILRYVLFRADMSCISQYEDAAGNIIDIEDALECFEEVTHSINIGEWIGIGLLARDTDEDIEAFSYSSSNEDKGTGCGMNLPPPPLPPEYIFPNPNNSTEVAVLAYFDRSDICPFDPPGWWKFYAKLYDYCENESQPYLIEYETVENPIMLNSPLTEVEDLAMTFVKRHFLLECPPSEFIQLTHEDIGENWYPSAYGNEIAWSGWTNSSANSEIFYWDGSSIKQLTKNSVEDRDASLYNRQVAWSGKDGDGDFEIFFWNGSQTVQITDNDDYDYEPSLYNGKIAWAVSTGNGYQTLKYWDGVAVRDIAYSRYSDFQCISLGDNEMAWTGTVEVDGDYGLYYWDGEDITKIGDGCGSLYKGKIAFTSGDTRPGQYDFEIFYWNGTTIIQVTDNEYDDLEPSLYDGKIAWLGSSDSLNPNNNEIYYWDGSSIAQITNDKVWAGPPSLSSDIITWAMQVNCPRGDNEIYYTPVP